MIYKVTDETFRSLCDAGHLASMEEFQLERSGSLSLETLNTFLCHCPNIRWIDHYTCSSQSHANSIKSSEAWVTSQIGEECPGRRLERWGPFVMNRTSLLTSAVTRSAQQPMTVSRVNCVICDMCPLSRYSAGSWAWRARTGGPWSHWWRGPCSKG